MSARRGFPVAIVAGTALLGAMLSCCDTALAPDYRREGRVFFQIRMDSIDAPDSVEYHDDVVVTFHGFVGADSCHVFAAAGVFADYPDVYVTVWGEIERRARCASGNVYLHDPVSLGRFLIGTRFLFVRQPDGTVLHDTITVYQKPPYPGGGAGRK